MKNFLKNILYIAITFAVLFFVLFSVFSHGYKQPLFFLSHRTVEKIEKSNYYINSDSPEILSDYRKTELTSGLSETKGKFNLKLSKEDILGWEEAMVYTVYLKPFGKIELIYVYEFSDEKGRTQLKNEILINGLVFVRE